MSGALIGVFTSQRGFAVVADAPGIGAAAATSNTTATVAYTAPANNGGATITSYVATSTPGSITGTLSTAGSGTITVSGLSAATSYTFTVRAVNSAGNSAESSASNSITTEANPGQQYWEAQSGSWTAPAGVTSVSVLGVGLGRSGELSYTGGPAYSLGGFGGSLSYINNYTVVPGSAYAFSASTISFFINDTILKAGSEYARVGDGGGNGAGNTYISGSFTRQGGSASGGYSGNGGAGSTATAGAAGSGGAPGGGSSSGGKGGGGVGIQGQGSSGAASASGYRGNAGSGGEGGGTSTAGGDYGGGGGTGDTNYAGTGAGTSVLRIMWPGSARQYPSTRTADE